MSSATDVLSCAWPTLAVADSTRLANTTILTGLRVRLTKSHGQSYLRSFPDVQFFSPLSDRS